MASNFAAASRSHLPKSMFITSALLFLMIFLNHPCEARNVLFTEESLYPGESLEYLTYSFAMTDFCNLVLSQHGQNIWETQAQNLVSNCRCTLEKNGQLVIYEGSRVRWTSSNAPKQGYYVLVLQKDRNVVIYGSPVWHTNTASLTEKNGTTLINTSFSIIDAA